MAYSSGFSPHPRISYANAAPTGAASEAEYLEIGLVAHCDPAQVQAALDAALPPGLDIVDVVNAPPGALADQLTGSRWQVAVVGVEPADQRVAADRFLAEDEIKVSRMTKNGLRTFDARGAVVSLEVTEGGLLVTMAHGEPLVRPDDVLTALATVWPAFAPTEVPVLTRISQGRLDRNSGNIDEPGS
jgi:radical SAM-linked protein